MLLCVECKDSGNTTGVSGLRKILLKCSMKSDDESIAKYSNYLNDEIIHLIKSDKKLFVVFKLFVEYFEKEVKDLGAKDIQSLSNNGILLIIKMCRQSNSNEEFALAVVKEHFLIDKIDGVYNSKIKKIGLSNSEMHWLSEMEKKYSFFDYELRELINQMNNICIDCENLGENGNFYVSSQLSSFIDRYLKLVKNTPNFTGCYDIIKLCSKINYPCTVDAMISILSISSVIKNDYHQEKLASLSIILEKVHDLFINQFDPSVISIEKLDRILDICREMSIFEYMNNINVNNIVNYEMRNLVMKLKDNLKVYIQSMLIIYVFNMAKERSGGNIDLYILNLKNYSNEISDYFSDFKSVIQSYVNAKVLRMFFVVMFKCILTRSVALNYAARSDDEEDDDEYYEEDDDEE